MLDNGDEPAKSSTMSLRRLKRPAPVRAQPVTRHSKVVSTGWAQLSKTGDFRNWCATVDRVLRVMTSKVCDPDATIAPYYYRT